jgi:hypothetical protein
MNPKIFAYLDPDDQATWHENKHIIYIAQKENTKLRLKASKRKERDKK